METKGYLDLFDFILFFILKLFETVNLSFLRETTWPILCNIVAEWLSTPLARRQHGNVALTVSLSPGQSLIDFH